MRRLQLLLLLACVFMTATAQTGREEIRNNLRLSASNMLAYMGPKQKLTPAPAGLTPFYISHYGRHGSRYLTSAQEYDYPYNVLRHADSLGVLSPLGRNVLLRLGAIRTDARGRHGDLTPLGFEQHRQIARRMCERFPQVFSGDAHVDARSTVVIRCVLSMSAALGQLISFNPQLHISPDASFHDMYYMNQDDPELWQRKNSVAVAEPFISFCERHNLSARLMERLFTDTAFVRREVNAMRLNYTLFRVASAVQNTELRKHLTLYDAFSDEELYQNWLCENARFYLAFGRSALSGGDQPFSQRNLLRRIIAEADSCIRLGAHGASLRFGHETMVLPLACLLDLNGYGQPFSDLEQLDRRGWRNYRIIPMAANVQFVFYRRSARDTDVVFKVLLNEDEATLPLKTSMAPYYRWRDFKDYYLRLLDDYDERRRQQQ